MRDRGDRGNVEHVQSRVAESLAEEKLRLRPDRLFPGGEIARVDEGGLDAEARQRIGEQIVRAAVERARCDDVRACCRDRGDRQVQRGLAARGRDRSDAAFQGRHPLLEHGVGGVGDARVDVPAALHVEERRGVVRVAEHEGRGEIDRNRARAGDRIGPLSGVQAERVELERSGCGHGVLLGVRPILAVGTLFEDEKNRASKGAVSIQKNRAVTARSRFPPGPVSRAGSARRSCCPRVVSEARRCRANGPPGAAADRRFSPAGC